MKIINSNYIIKINFGIKYITLFFIIAMFTLSCNDYEKTISVDDLTKGSWYLENSNLKTNLDNYMESRGVNEHIYRELQFIGYDENKSGKVVFFENINNVEACRSEGSYFAKRDESGVLHVTISGLSNSSGYCTYVNKLNGKYDYKYMLASDVDEKYSNTYKDVKWFILSKEGREVIFQKSNK